MSKIKKIWLYSVCILTVLILPYLGGIEVYNLAGGWKPEVPMFIRIFITWGTGFCMVIAANEARGFLINWREH